MHKDLYAFRREHGISQEQAASALGMSTNSYSKKERGVSGFSLDEAFQLGKFLHADIRILFPEYFFGDEVPKMHERVPH